MPRRQWLISALTLLQAVLRLRLLSRINRATRPSSGTGISGTGNYPTCKILPSVSVHRALTVLPWWCVTMMVRTALPRLIILLFILRRRRTLQRIKPSAVFLPRYNSQISASPMREPLLPGTGISGMAKQEPVPNPSHQYTAIGFYTVTLRVISSTGCQNVYSVGRMIRIVPGVIADFDFTNPGTCRGPFNVPFSNLTSGPGVPLLTNGISATVPTPPRTTRWPVMRRRALIT
jgi:hypothetical protein